MTPEQQAEEYRNAILKDIHDHPLRTNDQIGLDSTAAVAGVNRTVDDGFGTGEGWNQAHDRYVQMGQAGMGRAAPTLDQGAADQSRGLQMGGLGMLRAQATGAAPSSAAILSQRANQAAVQQAGMQMAGAKGGIGGHIAAARGAGMQAGNAMLAGNAQNANMRAAEISHGQAGYSGAAGAMRGQDIGAATTNAQLQAQQQGLNEARRQEFERLGFNTRNAQLGVGMEKEKQYQDAEAAVRANDASSDAQRNADAKTAISTAASVFGSDEKLKNKIRPVAMGSLGSLYGDR